MSEKRWKHCIQIREKTLEFSSTVLPTLFLYLWGLHGKWQSCNLALSLDVETSLQRPCSQSQDPGVKVLSWSWDLGWAMVFSSNVLVLEVFHQVLIMLWIFGKFNIGVKLKFLETSRSIWKYIMVDFHKCPISACLINWWIVYTV